MNKVFLSLLLSFSVAAQTNTNSLVKEVAILSSSGINSNIVSNYILMNQTNAINLTVYDILFLKTNKVTDSNINKILTNQPKIKLSPEQIKFEKAVDARREFLLKNFWK